MYQPEHALREKIRQAALELARYQLADLDARDKASGARRMPDEYREGWLLTQMTGELKRAAGEAGL